MKIFGKSPNGQLIRIGDDPRTAKWYSIDLKIKVFADKYKVGDEVAVTSERRGKGDWLIFIGPKDAKTEQQPAQVVRAVSEVPTKGESTVQTHEQKSKDVEIKKEVKEVSVKREDREDHKNESIVKQSVGYMTSETLTSMPGLVNPDNVLELIDKIYNKYLEKVR